jgi:hypothetical protein
MWSTKREYTSSLSRLFMAAAFALRGLGGKWVGRSTARPPATGARARRGPPPGPLPPVRDLPEARPNVMRN